MEENRFYLSTYLGLEHAMGNMVIMLSDGHFTREDIHITRKLLEDGDMVLCECEPREKGVYTIGMAKVLQFKKDGVTPDKIKWVYGREINLTGKEKIIDHRKGHKKGCRCGA